LRFSSLAALVASISFVCVACGSRGPLDEPEFVDVTSDSGAPEGGTGDGGGLGADASDGGMSVDASRDANTPIDCAVCIGQSCSNTILACVTSLSCLSTVQCVFGGCLSNGQVNPSCALGCTGDSGPSGLLDVLAILECVTQACGANCDSLLAGLGAGLGGGGGGGGGGFGGGDPASSHGK
jgi:hypothetical protein